MPVFPREGGSQKRSLLHGPARTPAGSVLLREVDPSRGSQDSSRLTRPGGSGARCRSGPSRVYMYNCITREKFKVKPKRMLPDLAEEEEHQGKKAKHNVKAPSEKTPCGRAAHGRPQRPTPRLEPPLASAADTWRPLIPTCPSNASTSARPGQPRGLFATHKERPGRIDQS